MNVKVINKSMWDLPKYETDFAAGLDIKGDLTRIVLNEDKSPKFFFESDLIQDKKIIIHPGGRCLIPTGLFVEIPKGYEIQIRPRSGLALKKGITVLNTPGTIDAEFIF